MMETISPKDQQILNSLQKSVDEAMERKKRLGQYAVVWRDGHPVIIGWTNTGSEQVMEATLDHETTPAPKQHRHHPNILGQGRTSGNLIAPIVDEKDRECLQE